MLTETEVEAYFTQCGVTSAAGHRGDWRDARCPFHEDRNRSFSFNVKSGGWKCQAGCGSGGLKELATKTGIPFPRSVTRQAPSDNGRKKVAEYSYVDAEGNLAYQAIRYETAEGKTFRQRRPTGPDTWAWDLKGVRLVLYRLPRIMSAPKTEPILIVEGEKDADNLTTLGFTATTNAMGAGKWRDDYVPVLTGRDVVLLPDNDEVGRKHMDAVAASLAGKAASIRILELPDLAPKGDFTDWLQAGGSKQALESLMSGAKPWTPPIPEKQPIAAPAQASNQDRPLKAPFLALGFADGQYHYLSGLTRQVVSLGASAHGALGLLALAPKSYWVNAHGDEKGRVDWSGAASDLMAACAKEGVFDHNRVRGRGAWHDQGRPVVHLGNAIIRAGERLPVGQPEPGGAVYPAALPIAINYEHPLPDAEAARLAAVIDLLAWEHPNHARLLEGWLALAPICGALAWRPHIWLTGAAGTGKSWVMDHLMRPLLGQIGLFVQGDTTEAGIRQALGYDARPVLFDEAEGESERSQLRLQNILGLMRQSSSDNGSVIVKGTSGGTVKSYCIRSAFAFSSIGVGLKQHADLTRVTVLSLAKREDDRGLHFAKLRHAAHDLLTTEWIARLHARMIANIPVVRASTEVLARAAGGLIGSQRMGDQLGTLLAGSWALRASTVITKDQAEAMIATVNLAEQYAIQDTPEEQLCLQHILQHVARFPGKEDVSIGQMIERSDSSLDPAMSAYREALMRIGIRIEDQDVAIANQHAGLAKILAGTPWADWGRLLRRLPGSRPATTPLRFAGSKVRAILIPRDQITN